MYKMSQNLQNLPFFNKHVLLYHQPRDPVDEVSSNNLNFFYKITKVEQMLSTRNLPRTF